MGSHTRQRSISNNLVFIANWLAIHVAFQDLPDSRGVARLRGEGSARNVWCHSMPRHRPPRVVGWWRLWEPNVTCVASKLTRLQRVSNNFCSAKLPTCGVHQVGSLFEQ